MRRLGFKALLICLLSAFFGRLHKAYAAEDKRQNCRVALTYPAPNDYFLRGPVYRKNKYTYEALDPRHPNRFFFRAHLHDGELSFNIRSRVDSRSSRYIYARKEFDRAIEHFGVENIKQIRLLWIDNLIMGEPKEFFETNLAQFNHYLAENAPDASFVEAAKHTWSGQRCLDYGFTHFVISNIDDKPPGEHRSVTVTCTRD